MKPGSSQRLATRTHATMGRSCTGLRNRGRDGQGSYSRKKKSKNRDSYGSWDQGVRKGGEVIAGRAMTYRLNTETSHG
jgi:hypothetical protein